ncbi:MAG: hypothetical protein OXC40_00260 [Proteobacteria bacterium]|nr:hypothetical protein [Pseudomonadota bacterium]
MQSKTHNRVVLYLKNTSLARRICSELGSKLTHTQFYTSDTKDQLIEFLRNLSQEKTGKGIQVVVLLDHCCRVLINTFTPLLEVNLIEMIWLNSVSHMKDIPRRWLGVSPHNGVNSDHWVLKHMIAIPSASKNSMQLVLQEIEWVIRTITGQQSVLFHPSDHLSDLLQVCSFKGHVSDVAPKLPDGRQFLRQRWLGSTLDKSAISEEVKAFSKNLGFRVLWSEKIYDIVEELLSNALYDAISAHQVDEYGVISKKRSLTLKPEYWSLVRWSWNGEVFIMSVTDPFGLLDPGTFIQYISKITLSECDSATRLIEHKKEDGAGLGLTKIFLSSDLVICRRVKSQKTEVLTVIRPLKEKAYFYKKSRSFHFFAD